MSVAFLIDWIVSPLFTVGKLVSFKNICVKKHAHNNGGTSDWDTSFPTMKMNIAKHFNPT